LNVSEQHPETVSGNTGSVATEPSTPDLSVHSVPVTAAAEVEAPRLAPDQEETAPRVDALKVEAAKEAPKVEAPKIEVPKAEPPMVKATEAEPLQFPGKMMIMSPAERAWNADEASSKPEAEAAKASSGGRRVAAMAAVVALATVAGALGGALATAGIGHFVRGDQAVAKDVVKDVAKDSALEATVARIDADITALKASVEHTTKMGMSQFNKTSDRLDKVEKAQAEPAAKLAELSKAVDKLRATPPAAPAVAAAATPVAAREVTGTVTAPATATAAPTTPPKPEVARLPTVEGWTLRDVANGGALIEGRQGMYEVYAGDPVPGLGRIDAIRKQDGRWVVVTTKGLIVAR
jgi:hypothetical protein